MKLITPFVGYFVNSQTNEKKNKLNKLNKNKQTLPAVMQ